MSELIDRYVHQVGLYVRPKERGEIEAELRSQIQDQLEDRYGVSPTQADVSAVLKQLGSPRTIAASYSGEQYLVGPELYPLMLTVLRFGLPLVPSVVVIVNIVSAALSPEGGNWPGLLIGSIFTAAQAALLFVAIVVVIFAILQHSGEELWRAAKNDFNPMELPAVNDPSAVDRFEAGVGIASGTLVGIAILYYLQVGGLTLRFNLNDPGDVLPVPTGWLIVVLFTTFGGVFLNLWALIRRRWTLATGVTEIVFDIVGAVGLYFALFKPLSDSLKQAAPELAANLPLDQLPLLITLFILVIMVLVSGSKLIRIWQQRQGMTA